MMPCRTILILAALVVLACESEGPSPGTDGREALHFTGRVMLQGVPADPTIQVRAEAYSTALPRGLVSHALQLDSTGAFVGAFAPVPDNQIDSLILSATQPTCDGSPTSSLRYGSHRVTSETLRLPTLNLQYPQAPADLRVGLEMCAALGPPDSGSTWVSLVIDSLADSAFGRYAIDHAAPVASDEGLFAGRVTDSLLVLRFVSEHYPPCTGVRLAVPLIRQDGFGLASLTGAAEDFCHIAPGRLRLFPHHYGFPPLPRPVATGLP
jgi:hypothetical protein